MRTGFRSPRPDPMPKFPRERLKIALDARGHDFASEDSAGTRRQEARGFSALNGS